MTSAISDADGLGAFSYQWLRNGVAVGGATATSYLLGNADVGTQISVQVSYTDGHGSNESLTSAPTAAVSNVNDPPVANNDSYTTAEDTALHIPAVGVLGNDSDIDADPLTALVVTGPAHGSLTLNIDGSFTYTPNANFNGSDGFTYLANDATTNSAPASVTINVTAVNDAPTANAATVASSEDVPYVFSKGDFNFVDVDHDPLAAVRIDSLPTAGQLRLNGTDVVAGQTITAAQINSGGLVFTPGLNGNGSPYATLNYAVYDGSLFSAGQTLRVDILAVNDAPRLVLNNFTVFAGSVVTLNPGILFAIDSDTLARDLIFHVASVRSGQFILAGNSGTSVTSFSLEQLRSGQVQFAHDGSDSAPSFEVSVSDGFVTIGPRVADISFFANVTPDRLPAPIDNSPDNGNQTPVGTGSVQRAAPGKGNQQSSRTDEQPLAAGDQDLTNSEILALRSEANGRTLSPTQAYRGTQLSAVRPYTGTTWQHDVHVVSTSPLRLEFGALNQEILIPINGRLDAASITGPTGLADADAKRVMANLSPEEQRNIQVVLNSTKLSGVVLSIGAVWWATRAGGLLASLAATAPAWRSIDPLPIFGRTDDEEKDLYSKDSGDDEAERDDQAVKNLLDANNRLGEGAYEGAR